MVSDNDGSAFITKAEFDSLKNNFQAQIDNYNSSIDSKIDGAIASYLAGIRMQSSFNEEIIYNVFGGNSIKWTSASLWPAWTTRTRWTIGGDICFWWGLQAGSQAVRSTEFTHPTAPVYITSGINVGTTALDIMKCYYIEFDDTLPGFPRLKQLHRYSLFAPQSGIYMQKTVPQPSDYNRLKWDWGPTLTDITNQATTESGSGAFISCIRNVYRKNYSAGSFSDYDMYTFGNAGDNDVVFCLKSSESNRLGYKLGDYIVDFADITKTSGPTQGFYWQGTPCTGDMALEKMMLLNLRDYAFEDPATFKPIDELYFSKSNENIQVKLYQGIPLFTASVDGHVTIKDLHSNSGAVRIAISDDKFGKEDPLGIKITRSRATVTESASGGKYYYTVPDNYKFDVEFDVEKDKTYYIKVRGSGSASFSFVKFSVDGPITTVGE